MAWGLSSQTAFILRTPLGRHVRSPVIARAQRTGDEGKSRNNIVDSNLNVLRERIEQVRVKERLKRCNQLSTEGWYYPSGYDIEIKRNARLTEFMQIASLAVGSFGFSLISGTFCLCLFSLLIHLINQN